MLIDLVSMFIFGDCSLEASVTSSKANGSGYKRVFRAFVNAMSGIHFCWTNEAAFRQEVLLSVVLYPLIFMFDISSVEKALLFASLSFVLIVELLNSAIEATIDRIGLEHNVLSGRAKDMGASAVLMAILMTVGVWLCVLIG